MFDAVVLILQFLLRIVLYASVLKLRSLQPWAMASALCAGIPFFVQQFPLPVLFQFIVVAGASVLIISRNCDAEPFPEALGIVLAAEFIDALLLSPFVLPFLASLLVS